MRRRIPYAVVDDRRGVTSSDEGDSSLEQWRARVIGIVFAIGCVLALPPLIAVLSGRLFHLPWLLRGVCVALYLVALVAAMPWGGKLHWRAGAILVVLAALGVMQLWVTQLAGDGRQSLLVLPLLALIFIGPRVGWVMVVVSGALFGMVALLIHRAGSLDSMLVVSSSPGFWMLQGVRLMGHMVFLTILLSWLQLLQRRTMRDERMARRKLEEEVVARKRLEADLARVSEYERRRFGSELHDGLCQQLTAVLLNCTALENRCVAGGAPAVSEVRRIREGIEDSIGMAYDVAHGLCPVDLDSEGFVSALDDLCAKHFKHHGVTCELQVSEHVGITDPDMALQLYRIAGEALNNASKHSGGTRVEVLLVHHPTEIVLSVKDNGKGIADDARDGLGRGIMAYRAGLIGGTLSVDRVAGGGTAVVCRVPVQEVSA